LDGIQGNGPVLGVLKYEENQHGRDGNARIQRRRQNVVILRPPREMASTNDELEYESDDTPRYVVDSGRRRDGTGTVEDDGEATIRDFNTVHLCGTERLT
jgi:hypothetical protein